MKKLLKSLFIAFSFFSFINTALTAQELNTVNSSWSTVIPGKVICQPQTTSFGFAVISDARTLMCYTTEGKFLWEKYLTKATRPFFSVLDYDFFAVVTNFGKRLTILNPDGRELWTENFDDKILDAPFSGRDGRIFVRTENKFYCYGINGLKKWDIETPEQNPLHPEVLPDGSLIVFLNQLSDGKTKAFRITPFGEIIEDITFAGEVTTSLTTPAGVFLTFTDGTSGLFDLVENKATHKWLFKKDKTSKTNKDFFILSRNKKEIVYINHKTSGIEVDYVNIDNGEIYKSFTYTTLKDVVYSAFTDDGVLLAGDKAAYFYSNRGNELWSGSLPDKKSKEYYNYLTFTEDNYFILFCNNWTINAFRTVMNASRKNNNKKKEDKPDYSAYLSADTSNFFEIFKTSIDEKLISPERMAELKNGNYGPKEAVYLSELTGALEMYKQHLQTSNTGSRVDKDVFLVDKPGLEKLISTIPLFESTELSDYTNYLLTKETEKTLLHTVLTGIIENPYDPELETLAAIEKLTGRLSSRDDFLLNDVINAVYAICEFNGKAALDKKGKDILTTFLYPNFKSTTRTNARNALKAIVSE
ncbi:MAG: hypothetical protein MJ162_06265 [Treponema sp.]|nr:hypothetical protein [Treponema sp.]